MLLTLPRGADSPLTVANRPASSPRAHDGAARSDLRRLDGAGAEFGVETEQAGTVAVDELQTPDDLRDGGFFLDLLEREPAEQRTGVEVADVSPPPSTDSIA